MGKENEISASKLLIVEGNHERDFFTSWFEVLGITDIQVMPIGGKTLLQANLAPLVKQSAFRQVTCLVVVRDADDDPQGAFQSVHDTLTNCGLDARQHAWEFTWTGTPRTAIVLMPQLDQPGALEELLMQTVQNDPMAAEAGQFIQTAVYKLPPGGPRKPPPAHKQGKARVHAFLATFDEPDKDQGKAAKAGVWNFNHPALQPLLAILRQM